MQRKHSLIRALLADGSCWCTQGGQGRSERGSEKCS